MSSPWGLGNPRMASASSRLMKSHRILCYPTSAAAKAEQSRTQRITQLKEKLKSVRKLIHKRRPSCVRPLSHVHLFGRAAPVIDEHTVLVVASIHECADSHPWHMSRLTWTLRVVQWMEQCRPRSDVLTQPSALSNDFVLQLSCCSFRISRQNSVT